MDAETPPREGERVGEDEEEERDAAESAADEDRASDEGMSGGPAPAHETPGGRNADIDRLLSDDSPR